MASKARCEQNLPHPSKPPLLLATITTRCLTLSPAEGRAYSTPHAPIPSELRPPSHTTPPSTREGAAPARAAGGQRTLKSPLASSLETFYIHPTTAHRSRSRLPSDTCAVPRVTSPTHEDAAPARGRRRQNAPVTTRRPRCVPRPEVVVVVMGRDLLHLGLHGATGPT